MTLPSRTVTALAGLLVSLAVSVAAYVFFEAVFLFFLVPFVPLLARSARPPVRTCPECGFRSRQYDYCPRDGTELERVDDQKV